MVKKFLVNLSIFFIILGLFKLEDITIGHHSGESYWFLEMLILGVISSCFTTWLARFL
jgi:hypothetical protein